MPTAEELLQTFDEIISDGVRRGMLHRIAEDDRLDGRTVTLGGHRLVNFGSCSYLGLETHPMLRAAVAEAVDRYGTQFSSSRAYLSAPAYEAAEQTLGELFGRPTVITPSTTMGHLATMPTLVASSDLLVLDHQVHHSVQVAAKLAQAQGTRVELIPHNDLRALLRLLEQSRHTHQRVWYAADGLYSMFADFAPIDELNELVTEHERLWLYIDDAHSFSWTGRFGRGFALDTLTPAAASRAVVAGSLNKSFAAAGGAVTFPDAESRRRVFTVGGPLIFSGPVQPPMLGAILASARLHLSPEIVDRQHRLRHLIRLFNLMAAEHLLPLISTSEAPIRFIGAGVPRIAYALTRQLRDAGFFVDTATFPAVPAKRSGARLTITAHHTDDDVRQVVGALAEALPRTLDREGSSPQVLQRSFARQLAGRRTLEDTPAAPDPMDRAVPPLRLEYHRTISTIERREWDAMFGDRGSFEWRGLHALEEVFARVDNPPEHRWEFHYWLVRDHRHSPPVAATFFTHALWKDDMLAPAYVSAEVESRRRDDPYALTSPVLAMGSLLTEGEHLYLNRDADWRAALQLILGAARAVEEDRSATAVVLRDLPDGDPALHDFLIGEGFARVPIADSWTRPITFSDDHGFLAELSKKARYHQRSRVLSAESSFRVTTYAGGSPVADQLGAADRDQLYELYRNVHARKLELNVFPLPRHIIDTVLRHGGWELLTLHVHGHHAPVAFAAQHVGSDHIQPVFIGLDYRFVASHDTYQQLLWQAVRSAQRHGTGHVLFGMSADLHKARFGARRHRRWVYIQATELFHADALAQLNAELGLRG
ncbi:hypothetical protein [Micromonospora sp. NPDC051141]|uniref:hypothetical protein n=1 Tax=Micromonospora sp. NPDC051141 TaxID=3364284 RepID=UPI0037A6F047